MDQIKELIQTGVFKTQNDAVLYLLAKTIREKNGPVGSWTLKDDLNDVGVECSTATIGRHLRYLDQKKYTVQKSNKGRLLTLDGKDWLSVMDERLARAALREDTFSSIKVNEYSELVDLLRVRKVIEAEAARLAALYATDEDIAMLRKSTSVHYRYIAEGKDPIDPALNFHAIICGISHNKFIKAMLDILIFEEKQIEEKMDTLLTRERANCYVVEHDDITASLEARNVDLAVSLMERHIDAIMSAVEEQIQDMKSQ
jgi:DNA-binding FadR family transcriptional regulator